MNIILIIVIVVIVIIAIYFLFFTDVGGDLLLPFIHGKEYLTITKGIKTGQHAPYDMWTLKYHDHISEKVETKHYYSVADLQTGLLSRYSGSYSGRITDTQYSKALSIIHNKGWI